MVRAALADRGIAQRLVLPRLGKRQQVLQRADAERLLHQQHVRRRREIRHRREILQRVIGQRLEQARVGRDAGVGIEQRVAVGRGLGDRVGADGVARARAVLDDHRHVPFVVEALRQRTRHGVDAAAGIERHHDLHRAVGKFGVGEEGTEQRGQQACGQGADRVFHARTIGHLFSRNRSARLRQNQHGGLAWRATSAWRSSAQGLGGLAAAGALRQHGIEVVVYERAPQLGEVGAGIQLGPNAVKVLRALGLEQALRPLASEPVELRLAGLGRRAPALSRADERARMRRNSARPI